MGGWAMEHSIIIFFCLIYFKCSRTCGIGLQFRKIECKVRPGTFKEQILKKDKNEKSAGSEPTVLSRMCMSLTKPEVSKQCKMNACDAKYHWSVGSWSQVKKNKNFNIF